jgi:hypothetical protein
MEDMFTTSWTSGSRPRSAAGQCCPLHAHAHGVLLPRQHWERCRVACPGNKDALLPTLRQYSILRRVLACRAVVARERLSAAKQLHAPCIAIPQSLEVSADVAAQELDRMLAAVGLRGVARLQPEVLIGLFLAYERTRGAMSRIANCQLSVVGTCA